MVNMLTPFMIFVMVYSVIAFLLDVRYVYLGLQKRTGSPGSTSNCAPGYAFSW